MKALIYLILPLTFLYSIELEDIEYKCDKTLVRSNYTACYNTTIKMPNYSFYKITNKEADTRLTRLQTFYVDPDLSREERSNDLDYVGYDKGHLAPASLMDTDDLSRKEANYLSNVVPQDSYFNRFGAWRDIERLEQDLVNKYDIEIISGATYKDKKVPSYMYKIIITPTQYVILLYPNVSIETKYKYDYIVDLDKFKEITGVNLKIPSDKKNFTKEELILIRP